MDLRSTVPFVPDPIFSTRDEDREEWIVLNPEGKELDIAGLKTDARQAYIDLRSGAATRAFVLSGTRVTIDKTTVFESAQRTDYGE